MGLYSIHLFGGIGGGILGDIKAGNTPICAVEIEDYPRRVLLQRQLDGVLPIFPIWDDILTFSHDNTECRQFFDRAIAIRNRLLIAGGFPCQDISAAGKGAGIDGSKSGLWKEFARVIREIRPKSVWVENSPILTVRGIDRVLWDLAAMGYDSKWGVVSAADSIWNQGYPRLDHKRDRIWIAGQLPDSECIHGSEQPDTVV